jgi:hypothetical protein
VEPLARPDSCHVPARMRKVASTGWSTQYADLQHTLVVPTDRFRRRRKTRVRAGDVLGHARRASLRLRFGLAQLGESGWVIVDPTGPMHAWSALPWFDDPIPRDAARRAA